MSVHEERSTQSAPVAKTRNEAKHQPALDGVRGLAILLVLSVHLLGSNTEGHGKILHVLGQVLASGYVGVYLFFALSGFLITGILMDTIHAPTYYKTFYARRSLRIFPLYYGVLILLLFLSRPFHFGWTSWAPRLFTYTGNLAFWRADQFIPVGPFNINHFWSLQVEEQFYLIWPFLVYQLRTSKRIVTASLWACLVIFGIRVIYVLFRADVPDPFFPYSFTFACADNLLYGCCLAALLRSSARDWVLRRAPLVFGCGAVAIVTLGLIYGGLVWQTNGVVPTVGFSLIAITCTALIALVVQPHSVLQTVFSNTVLRFFGRYSYGLYVFHYSIVEILGNPVRHWAGDHLHSKGLGVLVGAAVVLALSILVALLSYHLYELPFLRWKKLFRYDAPA